MVAVYGSEFSELKILLNTAVDFADLECEASAKRWSAVVKERDTMLEDAKKRMAENVICNLKKRNIEGIYCRDKKETVETILSLIEPGASIGWGGSASIRELGILAELEKSGHEMRDYPMKDKETMGNPSYLGSCSADCFLMGTNAITVKGELVNIDGAGNRVACLIHGPRQVIIVVGMNKLVRSIEDGIDRIQTQVCPIIADATGRKTPCGVKGVCMDCQSPDCMCCSIVVTRRSRYDGRIKVVIVGENLGY